MAARCGWCDSAELEPGFLEDSGQGSRGFVRWIAGPIELGMIGRAKRAGKQRLAVEAQRCRDCGHLEFFALEEL